MTYVIWFTLIVFLFGYFIGAIIEKYCRDEPELDLKQLSRYYDSVQNRDGGDLSNSGYSHLIVKHPVFYQPHPQEECLKDFIKFMSSKSEGKNNDFN